jgi:hypothetical protein
VYIKVKLDAALPDLPALSAFGLHIFEPPSLSSERFQPFEEVFVGSPAWVFRGFGYNRLSFGNGSSFGFEIDGHIFVRGVDVGVAQVMSDGAEIDAGFKQVNRGAVSYAMWMDAFAFERRLDFRSALNVPFQDETRTEASEGFTLPVPKYELRFVWIETAVMEVLF